MKLRSQVGGAYQRRLVQTNVVLFGVLAGAVVNREEFLDDTPGRNNLEGALAAELEWFTFDYPKTDVTSTFVFFPSLTDRGRSRMELDARVRRELVSDFFFNVTFRNSSDSDPPSENAARNDYSVVTSFGWSF